MFVMKLADTRVKYFSLSCERYVHIMGWADMSQSANSASKFSDTNMCIEIMISLSLG